MLSQAHQLFLCLSPSIYKGHRPLGDVKQKPRADSAVQTHTAQLNPTQRDHPDHSDPFCSLIMSPQWCLKEHLCPVWGSPWANVPLGPFPQNLHLSHFPPWPHLGTVWSGLTPVPAHLGKGRHSLCGAFPMLSHLPPGMGLVILPRERLGKPI